MLVGYQCLLNYELTSKKMIHFDTPIRIELNTNIEDICQAI